MADIEKSLLLLAVVIATMTHPATEGVRWMVPALVLGIIAGWWYAERKRNDPTKEELKTHSVLLATTLEAAREVGAQHGCLEEMDELGEQRRDRLGEMFNDIEQGHSEMQIREEYGDILEPSEAPIEEEGSEL